MASRGMTENYIAAVGDAHMQRRNERTAAITTSQAALARQTQVRDICANRLGKFPERSPLNVKLIETYVHEGYRVEVLTYQSIPGVITTANYYIPDETAVPFPAVVSLPAHYPQGKGHAECQRLGQLLARRGIGTLIIDLPGQGERLEFYDSTLRRSLAGKLVAGEQAHLGNLLLLSGLNLVNLMVWDVMRGLDMIIDRGDADPLRLGVTGCGGGALVARVACCLEPRIQAAVTVGDHYETEYLEGSDEDHVHFSALAYGVAALDMLLPFAPKPLLVAHCTQDRFKGNVHAHVDELCRFYGLLNAKENMIPFEADGPLGYLKLIRSRAAEHFARSFRLPDSRAREPETPPETPESLYCTETGQVCNSLNSVSLFSYNKNYAAELPPPLAVPRDQDGASRLQSDIRDRFRPFLRLPEPQVPIKGEIESRSTDWGYTVEKGRLIMDESLFAPYSFFALPESSENPASHKTAPVVLVLHERGTAGVSSQGAWMNGFAAAGCHVMAIDVCGIGETRLQPKGDDHDAYETLLCGPESQWARRALNAGLSLFGLRTFTVLRAIEFLRSRWDVEKDRISIIGVGRGGLWGLYAAAIDSNVSHCVMLRSLDAYKSLTERRRHNHHFSIYLPGCLQQYDLPQVAACIAPRPLTIVNPVNSRKERRDATEVQREFALASAIYKLRGAPQKLRILTTDSAPETFAAIRDGIVNS
jgi:cephalosporin-C deacetylase-like acetyl esterase